MKKIFIGMLVVISLFSFIGCGGQENSDITDNAKLEEDNSIDIGSISTPEEVKEAYNQNLEKISNKEELLELDIKEITKDKVIEYSNKATEIATKASSTTDKIDTIDKLVTLNDLSNNTSQEVMEEVIKHVIGQFENGTLTDSSVIHQNLYITRYLDKRLDNHPNLSKVDSAISNMNQIIKDTLREDNSRIEENMNQINKNIDFIKSQIE